RYGCCTTWTGNCIYWLRTYCGCQTSFSIIKGGIGIVVSRSGIAIRTAGYYSLAINSNRIGPQIAIVIVIRKSCFTYVVTSTTIGIQNVCIITSIGIGIQNGIGKKGI